ncbi:MAG: hypothetical protein CMJ15_00925 [Pelagibacterium sp.]|nr:hypothetical protein [Pelagibacterium sp.]
MSSKSMSSTRSGMETVLRFGHATKQGLGGTDRFNRAATPSLSGRSATSTRSPLPIGQRPKVVAVP